MFDSIVLLGFLTALLKFLAVAVPVLVALWLFLRKRVRRAWEPYKAAIEGMADLPSIREDVREIRGTLGLVEATMRAMDDINTEVGKLECSADGRITYANQAFARWLGVGKAELLDWNYTNFLHPEDRQRWREEWDLARHEHRVFNQRYRFVDVDGSELLLDVLLTPIPERPPAKRWVGVLRLVVE